jgi:general L-amino acid transport system permease protein
MDAAMEHEVQKAGPRQPPLQIALRLKRALGGRAGWGGFALQVIFVIELVWIG